MKITNIEIAHFGVWNDISLPLRSSGLSVFYGPNEAGKSTLMRFIRGMLYGFQPHDAKLEHWQQSHDTKRGTLHIDHRGQPYSLYRTAEDGSRGTVEVMENNRKFSADELLNELLSSTEEKLFEHVFALGLHELQELATLHDDDVAEHIYGMTLGPHGRQLLEMTEDIERQRSRLLDSTDESGELRVLLDRHTALSSEIDLQENSIQHHAELCQKRQSCQQNIDDLKYRQSGTQSQLQGHLFLKLVWTPWNKIRRYRIDLSHLPHVAGFPESGMKRLDTIENDLSSAVACRAAILSEANDLRRQAEQLNIDEEVERHAATMQSFVDQKQWLGEVQQQVDEADVTMQSHSEQLDQQLDELGSDWTVDRLIEVDLSPSAHYRMISMARSYQSQLARRQRMRRRIQQIASRVQQKAAQLNEIQQEQLDGQTIAEAIDSAQKQLIDLEDIGRLRLRETELEQRRIGIAEHLVRLQSRPQPPNWLIGVSGFFVVLGVLLAAIGIVTAAMADVFAGSLYTLLGAVCGFFIWKFKRYDDTQVCESIERMYAELTENEIRQRETREAIVLLTQDAFSTTDITDNDTANNDSPSQSAQLSDQELIRRATHHLAELTQLAEREEQIQATRRKLTELRTKFRSVQQDVTVARQDWCELLSQLGFDEAVRIDDAFAIWQKVIEANEQRQLWQTAKEERDTHHRQLQCYRQRIEELGHRMHCWDLDYENPSSVLDAWENDLKEYAEHRKERQRLQQQENLRRAEVDEYQQQIDELKLQRSALLVQGGAASREEFEQRASAVDRSRELEDQIAEAELQLEESAKTEPELAIVEEDLIAYNADENTRCIHTLNKELEDLEFDLEEAFENLGRIKQEITTLETDRTSTKLRFEREQIAAKLKRKAEDWFAIQLTDNAVEKIRSQFERTCQPATLAAASRFLERLSCGRHRNIWAPLGKHELCVDDARNRTLRVEQMSGGTREQLFLAIRLAMVQSFANEGIELPMVLDDVIVNFDQRRTEAAVETLLEFAEQGQQVLLFTCHLHLAHLFESKGIEPIWLPGHDRPLEERRAG